MIRRATILAAGSLRGWVADGANDYLKRLRRFFSLEVIEVSEEDYRRERAAGVEEECLLKPGRYKMKRGGFLARHPELKIKERKRA